VRFLRLGWGAVALLGAVLAGTAGCTVVDFTNTLEILVAPDQDPLAGASSLEVTLYYPEGEPVVGQLTVAQGAQEVVGLRPGTGVKIELVARDYDGTAVALGRSGPIDIGEDGLGAAVFLGAVDSLARIPEALAESRAFAAVVPLPNQQFAIVGGGNGEGSTALSAELFGSNALAPLSSEPLGVLERIGHQAVYLPRASDDDGDEWAGQIVIIGGTTGTSDDTWSGSVAGASFFVSLLDPISGDLEDGVGLPRGVLGASAVLTPEGKIAVIAGIDDNGAYRDTVVVLDPRTGSRLLVDEPPKNTGRVMHQLTPLEVAGVPQFFLTGGLGESGLVESISEWNGNLGGEFSTQRGMELKVPRARHQATALPGARILISGGAGDLTERIDDGLSIPSVELIDAESGTGWLIGDTLDVPRQRHVAVAISGDRVLICAGLDSSGAALGSCEVYDSETESLSGFLGGSMSPGGAGVSAAPLPDGRVIFAGGSDSSGADNSVYIYTPTDWQD